MPRPPPPNEETGLDRPGLMSNDEEMRLILGALVLSAFIFASCVSHPPKPTPSPPPEEFVYFSVLHGVRVVCREAEETSCGITLTNCSTNFRYECVRDVVVISRTVIEGAKAAEIDEDEEGETL